MEGYVPDGALVRFSMVGDDADAAFQTMERFIPELLTAIEAPRRRALIGTQLAKTMSV